MKYYKLEIEITDCGEMGMEDAQALVAAIAGENGAESFEQPEDEDSPTVTGYIQQKDYDDAVADSIVTTLAALGIDVSINATTAEYKNWNAEWEAAGYEPITVDGCCIHDTMHVAPKGTLLDVTIEARQAFGTGTHQTTQMLVGQLMNMPLEGKTVLDCGCGTGILGIVAALRDAKHITAYDIDEWSTENTEHNALLNGVADRMEVLLGDSSVIPDRQYDFVIANINRNILMGDMERFGKALAKGGTLLLSGFYDEDVDILASEARKYGLSVTKKMENGDWRAIRLSK